MAGEPPRPITPRLVAELARLRNCVKAPQLVSGARIEPAHITRWIISVNQAIADAVPDNDQIFEDNRRRSFRVMKLVDGPNQSLTQVDDALQAERFDELSRSC